MRTEDFIDLEFPTPKALSTIGDDDEEKEEEEEDEEGMVMAETVEREKRSGERRRRQIDLKKGLGFSQRRG